MRTTSSTPRPRPALAALRGDANPVVAEDLTTVLMLLDERRSNLTTQRTRLVNQLHALLRDLIPGGAPTRLSATAASRILTGVRPAGPVETARKQLARDLIADIGAADHRLTLLHTEIEQVVDATGGQLSEVDGIGPVIPGRLLKRARRASRFPTAAAFANYAGVAPVEVAFADHARHRLPRGRPSDGPGRTHGGDSAIQRGWLNPDHQPFGQVTSRARQHRLYDRTLRC